MPTLHYKDNNLHDKNTEGKTTFYFSFCTIVHQDNPGTLIEILAMTPNVQSHVSQWRQVFVPLKYDDVQPPNHQFLATYLIDEFYFTLQMPSHIIYYIRVPRKENLTSILFIIFPKCLSMMSSQDMYAQHTLQLPTLQLMLHKNDVHL